MLPTFIVTIPALPKEGSRRPSWSNPTGSAEKSSPPATTIRPLGLDDDGGSGRDLVELRRGEPVDAERAVEVAVGPVGTATTIVLAKGGANGVKKLPTTMIVPSGWTATAS